MKKLYSVSEEEKNRIRGLHESFKNSAFGVIKEQEEESTAETTGTTETETVDDIMKNVKIVAFSTGTGHATNPRSPREVGRWKLITCRFYLDIPINQYPDFGVLGGDEYTTIPWPNITPIIGGVNEQSKYKTSIQDTLSGGNISATDVIDERFLINDLENDEMGKSVNRMDLEQVRYFNKSYDINSLLNISTVPFYNDFNNWDGNTPETTFSEESLVGQIFINDNLDLDLKQSCKLELNTGNLIDNSIYDSSGNSNKGLVFGDFKLSKTKGEPMSIVSFIKVPKKINNTNGAL